MKSLSGLTGRGRKNSQGECGVVGKFLSADGMRVRTSSGRRDDGWIEVE